MSVALFCGCLLKDMPTRRRIAHWSKRSENVFDASERFYNSLQATKSMSKCLFADKRLISASRAMLLNQLSNLCVLVI